jgi:hypothetical protein
MPIDFHAEKNNFRSYVLSLRQQYDITEKFDEDVCNNVLAKEQYDFMNIRHHFDILISHRIQDKKLWKESRRHTDDPTGCRYVMSWTGGVDQLRLFFKPPATSEERIKLISLTLGN